MNNGQSSQSASVRACPQVKICGLTQPDEAAACAQMGADAIGLVFFSKSPRNVTREQAKTVVAELPQRVAAVGVFVNAAFAFIMDRVIHCGLTMVQLHGQEPPRLSDRLQAEGLGVIKALFVDGEPGFDAAGKYRCDAFLTECAKGPLPGGNALAWNWGAARALGHKYPLVLAGGLSPDNVHSAIRNGLPAAIDISSGVEASPGRKDMGKVTRLLTAVHESAPLYAGKSIDPVFKPKGDKASV